MFLGQIIVPLVGIVAKIIDALLSDACARDARCKLLQYMNCHMSSFHIKIPQFLFSNHDEYRNYEEQTANKGAVQFESVRLVLRFVVECS